MLPGDRLVCVFVGREVVGAQFKKWLLHVTIVPWLRLPDDTAQLEIGLTKALTTVQPFNSQIIGEEKFGPKKNRPAHLLEPSKFPETEQRVRSYLHKKRAWLVDETTKRPRQFMPHVTFQDGEHLENGQEITIDRLYIVEQKGDYKEIVAEILLGKATA